MHLIPKALSCPENGLADLPRSGRSKVVTDAVAALLHEHLEKVHWICAFRELAEFMKEDFDIQICWKTYANWMHASGWDVHGSRETKPMLSEKQKVARKLFANAHLKNDWAAWVDIDEKWWYTVSLNEELKLPPGEKPAPLRVQSKSNIPKVMFLTAVARPNQTTDGKIGMWRVSETKVAARKSKNHARGEEYPEDVTMTADLYFKMMTEKVFPAVRAAFPNKETVFIQHDGATPHTGKKMLERLNDAGSAFTSGPKLVVVLQPSNSPDFNICDLSFFRGLLAGGVRKFRRKAARQNVFDKEQLVADVMKAWRDYPPEQLEKMWEYKHHIMAKVKEVNGDNVYDKRRKSTPGFSPAPIAKRARHDAR
jgi:hypothetical protein